MDRLQKYLEVIPLPVLLIAPFVGLFAFLFMPKRLRLDLMIIAMVMWLVLGRLVEIGVVQQVTKATTFAIILALGLAAWLDPVPKRRLPMIVWAYPIMACIAYVYVLTVEDFALAVVLRTQWLFMCVAAILVAQTVRDDLSMVRVLRAFAIGLGISVIFPLSDLLLHPSEAIRKGLGRFEPYGTNSNQIGVLFTMAFPLLVLFGIHIKSLIWKPMALGIAAIALGLGLLTGSRSTLITMVLPSIPCGLALARRPVMLIVGGAMGVVLLALVIQQAAGNTAFDRFQSIETGRVEIFMDYLRESVAERPIFGLLGTQGMSVLRDEAEGTHAHNAYLEITYMGGLSFSFPMLILAGVTMASAAYVYMKRKQIHAQPVLTATLVAFTFTVYAQGFVNGSIYYPTNEWAFFHLFLSMCMLTWASDLMSGREPLEPWDAATEGDDGYGDGQESDAA